MNWRQTRNYDLGPEVKVKGIREADEYALGFVFVKEEGGKPRNRSGFRSSFPFIYHP